MQTSVQPTRDGEIPPKRANKKNSMGSFMPIASATLSMSLERFLIEGITVFMATCVRRHVVILVRARTARLSSTPFLEIWIPGKKTDYFDTRLNSASAYIDSNLVL